MRAARALAAVMLSACGLALCGCAATGQAARPAPGGATLSVRDLAGPDASVTAGFSAQRTGLPRLSRAIVTHGPRDAGRLVALTFDLCASPGAPESLDRGVVSALEAKRAPATFMMGGLWAQQHPAEAQQLAGVSYFEIGNHSMAHGRPLTMSDEALRADTRAAQSAISSATGITPRVYRFPFEQFDARTVAAVGKLGLVPISNEVNPGDPDPNISAKRIAAYVPETVRPGSIVIFHANGNGVHTAAALPGVIDGLRKRGYTLVTVSELLAAPASSAGPAGERLTGSQ